MDANQQVSIGLRARSGRAIVVVLGGPVESPVVIRRGEVQVAEPAERQPYHAVIDLPWEEARRAVRPAVRGIERAAERALGEIVRQLRAERAAPRAVAIVGAGPRDLARIGSSHVRAHAAEGVLFREVLEAAARGCRLPHRSFDERKVLDAAAERIGRPRAGLDRRLADLGRTVGPPWRADEKAAAAAAWALLASPIDR